MWTVYINIKGESIYLSIYLSREREREREWERDIDMNIFEWIQHNQIL